MGFSFVSESFQNALDRLFETAQKNLNSKDDETKNWANKVRSLKEFFTNRTLEYLDINLHETKKWNLFDVSQLADSIIANDLLHLKYGALSFYVYLKEWEFRRGIKENEQHNPIVRSFYDFIYTEKNQRYLEFKTHYDFVDELPFVICGEIYSDSKLSEIRNFLEEKDFSDFNSFVETNTTTFEMIKKWEESFDEKKQAVLDLENRLKKSKETYDFILLNKGFKELYEQKKEELKERRDSFSKFGATLAITPLTLIIFSESVQNSVSAELARV
ncbi:MULTISPECIES: hypothetical protein [Acinetobacter]|uniref:Uncharacterized protein n=1 Tax=Acinetobacter indicus TaxID=756892 RepID=A0A7S7AFD1_9GAMM|nr:MULTISPECIES: hypothetical protein [Acinetobacter]MDM1770895.1 hypothetical protein [Acinetobacter indicus]MDM1773579.1 hypothetical protein [Acinetobacter indicus]QOW43714.1 hypothetical protein G0027_13215 [Acinetobacter indicus]RVT46182.1 hypothetical protein ENC21_14690 [Acinetobacter indicus]UNW03525.1 hypothetical protein MOW12_10440 [Acinetobacter indicus]